MNNPRLKRVVAAMLALAISASAWAGQLRIMRSFMLLLVWTQKGSKWVKVAGSEQ
jgi:hypothetical protein